MYFSILLKIVGSHLNIATLEISISWHSTIAKENAKASYDFHSLLWQKDAKVILPVILKCINHKVCSFFA